MINFKLNGQEMQVEPGTTILNAARARSIDIPTFCYQDRLSILASCRMCLVEVEGRPKLEPACATVVSEGMEVLSHSQKVVTSREDMLEILLANHPLDCPVCDKSGECELQDTVFDYGKGDSRLYDPKRVFRIEDIELNGVITFNANRCIQCQRCVRVCEEVVGEVALGTMERGLDSEITGVGNSLKDCSHCGNCIEVCPVGALMSIPYRYKARPWDLERTDTVCSMCGTGCNMTIETRDGELMRVKSKYETGINGELLCAKGRFGFDFIDGGKRITEPMIRKNDVMTAVSWSEVIDFIANKVQSILKHNGHIKGLISPRQTNETAFMFQKLMSEVFQSSDIHSSCRYSGLHNDPEALSTLQRIIMQEYSRQPLDEILQASSILLISSNITAENPVTGYLIRQSLRDHHNDLFIASSQPSGLDDIARKSYRLLPGNEALLLSSLAAAPLSGMPDEFVDFISDTRENFSNAASITLLVGCEFLRTDKVNDCLLWIEKTIHQLQKQGKKIYLQFLFDRPNQLGLWHMGCLPDQRTLRTQVVPEMFYVVGADPIANCPKDHPLEQAALNSDCLIVQNSVMTASTQHAMVILPAPACGQENGTYTNNEARVQKVKAVRPLKPDILTSTDIFGRIANALQKDIGAVTGEQIFSRIRQQIAGYQDLRQELILGPEQNDYGLTTASPIENSPSKIPEVSYSAPTGYTLITGDSLFRSGKLTAHSKNLATLGEGAYVEMNPGAEFAEQQHHYQVTISQGDSSLTARLKINRTFPEKLIYIPEDLLGSQANKLINANQYPSIVEVKIRKQSESG